MLPDYVYVRRKVAPYEGRPTLWVVIVGIRNKSYELRRSEVTGWRWDFRVVHKFTDR